MPQAKGIGGHHRAFRGRTDEWLTPPDILKALGPFDLDPCSPVNRPWPTAARHLTERDDGLLLPWEGRVWLNPPYGPETGTWLKKLADHGNDKWAWNRAHAMLFLLGRLHFYSVAGKRSKMNAGAPSVLIAYGAANAERLRTCGIAGRFVQLI